MFRANPQCLTIFFESMFRYEFYSTLITPTAKLSDVKSIYSSHEFTKINPIKSFNQNKLTYFDCLCLLFNLPIL